MIIDIENKNTDWSKLVNNYMEMVNLNITQIKTLSIIQIKNKINEWDRNQWYQSMEDKSTLELYRNNKKIIQEVKWMRNGYKYGIMMKARADALDLEWRVLNPNVGKICKLCNEEVETLEHFILKCVSLQEIRNQYIQLQWPSPENNKNILKNVLLFEIDEQYNFEYYVNMLYKLWRKRELLTKNI